MPMTKAQRTRYKGLLRRIREASRDKSIPKSHDDSVDYARVVDGYTTRFFAAIESLSERYAPRRLAWKEAHPRDMGWTRTPTVKAVMKARGM
jgi:hypothetical protein